MKTKPQSPVIFFLIVSVLILSCGPVSEALLTPADDDLPPAATSTALPATTPTATLTPTVAPTVTVYPPVFDPEALGDNRMLDSFIMTRTDTITGGGDVETHQKTSGYIKEPFSAYLMHEFSLTGFVGGVDKKYWIGGRSYETNATVDWSIQLEADRESIDSFLLLDADMRSYIRGVLSAQFAGQEDFEGIPANHFTFDQTNLRKSDPTGTYKIEAAEGDLYLAQDGNYPLYFHSKETGNVYSIPGESGYVPGVREITEELTSINQLTEIAVPAVYLEAEQTLLDLSLPLPADTTLTNIGRFSGTNSDHYHYAASVSNAEFLEFYRNLVSANGWTVSHIGEVALHFYCDLQGQECVIINKGDEQIVLFYQDGVIQADYDRDHEFSPR